MSISYNDWLCEVEEGILEEKEEWDHGNGFLALEPEFIHYETGSGHNIIFEKKEEQFKEVNAL